MYDGWVTGDRWVTSTDPTDWSLGPIRYVDGPLGNVQFNGPRGD